MFYAAIHEQYTVFSASIGDYFLAAYFCYLIFVVGVDKFYIIAFGENKLSSHRSLFAYELRQFTGVDTKYTGHFIFFQPITEAFSSIPVTVFKRKIGNNQS